MWVQRNLLVKPTSTSRRLSNSPKQQKWPNRTRRTYRSCMHRSHQSTLCGSSKADKTGVTAIAAGASTPQTPVVSRIRSAFIVTKRDISPRSAVPRQKRNIRNDEPVRTGSRVRKTFCKGKKKVGPTLPTLCLRWKMRAARRSQSRFFFLFIYFFYIFKNVVPCILKLLQNRDLKSILVNMINC